MIGRIVRLAVLATILLQAAPAGGSTLGLEERLAGRRAVEQVYWSHRIWPADNPLPKPSLDAVLPAGRIRSEVEDGLRKSDALGRLWAHPVTALQLQAELDRIVHETRNPGMLRELTSALGNDPELIVECLVRPILADRLLRASYERDPQAGGSANAPRVPFEEWWTSRRAQFSADPAVSSPTPPGGYRFSLDAMIGSCTDDAWSPTRQEVPDPRRKHTAVWTGSEMIVWGGELESNAAVPSPGGRYDPATDTWSLLSQGTNAPAPRTGHTAVWTGMEMIVWGGSNPANGAFYSSGGRYNPVTDSWARTSTGPGVPTGRSGHTAIWTSSVMIVWGGSDPGGYRDSGSRYSPTADAWTPITSVGAPAARAGHTAVWTGSAMIVWGGGGPSAGNTGGRYFPSTNTWLPTSIGANVPSPAERHTAVWTGSEMIIYGGTPGGFNGLNGARYNPVADTWAAMNLNSGQGSWYDHTAVWTGSEMIVWGGATAVTSLGARYNPATDSWALTSTGANVPAGRVEHTAVWTGSEMIVWGGYGGAPVTTLDSGGRYTPATDSWLRTPISITTPAARYASAAVWTGSEMLVWGGQGPSLDSYATGSRYDPAVDSWTPTSTGAGVPVARSSHTGIWTGREAIFWGGNVAKPFFTRLNSGGRYDPMTDSWTPTSVGINVPSARDQHTAVWTGSEMIVWGGTGVNTGGRYDPANDTWLPTSVGAGVPSGRSSHVAVWTGSEMIVWGGSFATNTGGRYNPSTDSWTATSLGAGLPSARSLAAAVWTGNEMIVWGGQQSNGQPLNTGGRYNPLSDSWMATSTGAGDPPGRSQHTAVWTGSEMIVWGGGQGVLRNSGGRYDPAADSWRTTSIGAGVPGVRTQHMAVWTGSEMIVWGGWVTTSTGGLYCAGACQTPAGLPSIQAARLAGAGAGVRLSWSQVSQSVGYDVVRGGLGSLHSSLGDFTTSTQSCAAENTPASSMIDLDLPPAGDGFWYLVRAVNCGAGSYDENAPSQIGLRDAEIQASSGACR